jgi:hypothetical protein
MKPSWKRVESAVYFRVSCKSAAVKRRLYVHYLECVIQGDCYSSCVLIALPGK